MGHSLRFREVSGGDRLYRTLNQRESYDREEGDERSELEYLQLLRQIRDRQPDLFDKIKKLPRKARTAQRVTLSPNSLFPSPPAPLPREKRLS
ncbi:hypothetical protein L5470_07500 [Synechococcus sp. PCC 6717]|nr:hypothetical protein [Synechococcus sp. PCC 6717]